MPITLHDEVTQGTPEWLALRCGLLTASEMDSIITPTLKISDSEASRKHMYHLLAQRITGYVEPQFISDAMLRGHVDEEDACNLYAEHYGERHGPVQKVGFVTNDRWGFTLGYSPDRLVGDDGLVEVKSRAQKYQLQTLLDGAMPKEFMLQVQTGLLVSERKWCDFVTYCGGMHMMTIRVFPDLAVQEAILRAAKSFYQLLEEKHQEYLKLLNDPTKLLIPTERKIEQEVTPSHDD